MGRIFLNLIIAGLFAYSPMLLAQTEFQSHFLPGVNFSTSITNDWKATLSIASRQQLRKTTVKLPTEEYRYLFTDAAFILSKKTGLNNTLAGGYLFRFGGEKPQHRAIQQFTIVRRYNSFRLGHRFSADQTFSSETNPVFRLRYRITPELPLEGLAVDPNEFYLKVNNEYLQKFNSGDYDLEIRLAPFLGYSFRNSNKLESGVEYRIDSFLRTKPRNRIFFMLTWYQEI